MAAHPGSTEQTLADTFLFRLLTFLSLLFAVALIVLSHLGPRLFQKHPEAPGGPAPDDVPLLLIMDVSGSMSAPDISAGLARQLLAGKLPPSRISLARDAIMGVASSLPAGTTVGLRLFASETGLVVVPSPAGAAEIQAVAGKIEVSGRGLTYVGRDAGRTDVGGSTRIDLALLAAGEDITAAGSARRWKWILVSDGQGDPPRSLEAARKLAAQFPELTCNTINIGPGTKELEEIARILRGNHQAVSAHGLLQAMQEAASLPSLAGFSGVPGSKAPPSPISDRVSEGLFFLVFVLAFALRKRIAEGTYELMLCLGAGALAWSLAQLLLPTYGAEVRWVAEVQNAAYFMVVGTLLAAVLAISESLYLGDLRRAASRLSLTLPVGIFLGALAGYLGQFYIQWVYSWPEVDVLATVVGRTCGWAIAGAVVGASAGAASLAPRKLLHGLLGGAVGGALAGLVFEVLCAQMAGVGGPRFVALMILALLVGLTVRTVDELRKFSWLVVEKGGPRQKRYILQRDRVTLGTDHRADVKVECRLHIPLREEAVLLRSLAGYRIESSTGDEFLVNGQGTTASPLKDGDRLEISASTLVFHSREILVPEGEDLSDREVEERLPESG